MRIGVPRGYFWEGLDAELAQVMDVALARLHDSGVVLVEADLAGIGDINSKISFPIALYEVGPDLTAYLYRQIEDGRCRLGDHNHGHLRWR